MTDLSFDSILEELQNSTKTLEISNLIVKELTLKHQRMILNIGNAPVTMPAKLSSIYNTFITELVELTDQMLPVENVITIAQKPFILNIIRKLSIGDEFVRRGVKYHLHDVTKEDIEQVSEQKEIKFGNFAIGLKVPTLAIDSYFNNEIVEELKSYKIRRIDDSEIGAIGDTYQMFEIMKFINRVTFKDTNINFFDMSLNERKKFLNLLPKSVSDEIVEYIKEIKDNESKAYEITDENGDISYVDSTVLFFGKEID